LATSLSNDEAAALNFCLSRNPWWCSNAKEFPRLLTASRQHPLLPILEKLELEYWDSWSWWDRWCCIAVAFSSCAPIINTGIKGEEVSSCSQILQRLLRIMQKESPKKAPGLFGKIADVNSPDNHSPQASNMEINDEEIDEGPLPEFPTEDVDEEPLPDLAMDVDEEEEDFEKFFKVVDDDPLKLLEDFIESNKEESSPVRRS
jgi:hypothetical protein